MDMGNSVWFLGLPVIVVMVINLVFVANVIRVIKRKRGMQSENRSAWEYLVYCCK